MDSLSNAPPIDAEQGRFSVHIGSPGVAAEIDDEGKGKNTVRQLLQPGSCLERRYPGRPT